MVPTQVPWIRLALLKKSRQSRDSVRLDLLLIAQLLRLSMRMPKRAARLFYLGLSTADPLVTKSGVDAIVLP